MAFISKFPLEIIDYILDDLDLPSLYAACLCSRAFREHCQYRLLIRAMDDRLILCFDRPVKIGRDDSRTQRKSKKSKKHNGRVTTVPAYSPFVVVGVWLDRSDPNPAVAGIDLHTLRFLINGDSEPGDVRIDLHELKLTRPERHYDELWPWEEHPEKKVTLDWERQCKGSLARMTADLLREHHTCPECNNERDVCPGCGGFYDRWEGLSAGCGWKMPCPCCIGLHPGRGGQGYGSRG